MSTKEERKAEYAARGKMFVTHEQGGKTVTGIRFAVFSCTRCNRSVPIKMYEGDVAPVEILHECSNQGCRMWGNVHNEIRFKLTSTIVISSNMVKDLR